MFENLILKPQTTFDNPDRVRDMTMLLDKEIKQHRRSAIIKGVIAHTLFWIVILASGVGLFGSALGLEAKALSIIASIPGIALIISNTFKYESRSRWNKMKQRKLEYLLNRLKFEGASVAQVSAELNTLLQELDSTRVQLEKPVFTK